MLLELLFVVTLIFFSGLLSCGETSLTAADRGRLYKKKATNRKSTKRAIELVEKKDKVIPVLLLGNNALNILATSITTLVFVELMGSSSGVIVATVLMTVLLFLFGEFIPKIYALHRANLVILNLSLLMQWLTKLLYPLVKIMEEAMVHSVLKILGINSQVPPAMRDQEDLKNSIELHEKDGFLVKENKNMLTSVCDLEKIQVEEVMLHRKSICAINIDWSEEEILNQLKKYGHSYFPVWKSEPGNVVGVLETKSLLGHSADSIDLQSIIQEPWFVPHTRTLNKQLELFKEKSTIALVVDEYGTIMGIITLQDIMEEIIGRLPFRKENQKIIMEAQGMWLVDGNSTLRDVRRITDLDVNSENANTVAGFIIDKLGSIPKEEQVFVFDSVKFEVVKKEKNQITKIRISKSDSTS